MLEKAVHLVSALVLSGCVATNAVMLNNAMSYPPTQSADILSQFPNRSYMQIAIVEAHGAAHHQWSQVLEELRQKAMSVGANAVVVGASQVNTSSSQLMYNPTMGGYQMLGPMNTHVIRGVAIRYQ